MFLLRILSLLVSLIVSPHYAVLLSVRLIHALNIVSSYVLFIVLHVVLLSFYIVESIELVASFPVMIPSTAVTSLFVVASNFDRLMAGTQGFVDRGIVEREAIVMGSSVFNWFLDFEGDRCSSGWDRGSGSLFNKGGSYGSGLYLTLS